MTVLERIIDLLDRGGVDYEKVQHAAVKTSEEAAKIRNTDMSVGAKALVFFADEKPILVVVPGDKRVDTQLFKNTFGINDLRFATAKEVLDVTGIEIGAVPPVGKALNLKSYFDESFKQKENVAFNAGKHTISIYMKASDLIKTEEPEFGDFAR